MLKTGNIFLGQASLNEALQENLGIRFPQNGWIPHIPVNPDSRDIRDPNIGAAKHIFYSEDFFPTGRWNEFDGISKEETWNRCLNAEWLYNNTNIIMAKLFSKCLGKFVLMTAAARLVACDAGCSDTEEYLEIKSVAVIDTILSNRHSYGNCSSDKCTSYEIPFQHGYKDTISLSVVVLGDTLDYVVGGKDLNNTYIVIDSVETPCDSSYSIISKRGSGHYRVDSKRLYSCVFYFEPSCP